MPLQRTEAFRSANDVAIAALGRPEIGRNIIVSSGCGACHEIPGIPAARGRVGPPLTGFADRPLLAGIRRNSPDNLVAWLQDPRAINQHTAMPDLGLTRGMAHDVAAYLYARTGS